MSNNVKDVSIIQGEQGHLIKVMAQGGKELSGVIAALILKGEEVDAGPVSVLTAMRRIYNRTDDQGNEIDNISIEFPELNTSSIAGDDEAGWKLTNDHAERYEAPVTKNGETKTKKLNWFTEAWETTDEGNAQLFVLSQCKMALGSEASKAEPKFKEMSRVQLTNLQKKTKNAKTKGRAYLRKARGLWGIMVALWAQTNVKGDFIVTLEESENSATANSYPYDLVNHAKRGVFQPMKVSDVLKLDVHAALAEGGDLYDKLVAQMSRDTSGTKNKKYPRCENKEQIYDAIAAIVNGVDDNPTLVTALQEAMAKKKGGAEYVQMIGRLVSWTRSVWTKSLEIRYARELEKEIEHGGDEIEAEEAERSAA